MESEPLCHQGSLNRVERDSRTGSQGLAEFRPRERIQFLLEKQKQLCLSVRREKGLVCNQKRESALLQK